MRQIVPRVYGHEHFPATWAEEDESSLAVFRRWAFATQRDDGDGHRQIIAKPTRVAFDGILNAL